MNDSPAIPTRLSQIIDDFALSEGREKIELLIDYSERLPPLPEWLRLDHNRMDQVQECMTPVFIHADLEDGRLTFYFDVPPESPTVRGFAAIMQASLNGATPEQVLAVPADFYQAMGLDQVLTQQRLNGISAILAYMKRLALTHKLAE
jgi:cysteine desulfuration protein SufE